MTIPQDPSKHPRGIDDGQYVAKTYTHPDVEIVSIESSNEEYLTQLFREQGLSESDAKAAAAIEQKRHVEETMQETSENAGLGGVMPPVFTVLRDREALTDDQLTELTVDEIYDIYEDSIAPGIDKIEDYLLEDDEGADSADESKTAAHVQAVSDEAELGGIMPALLEVVADRERVSAGQMQKLTAADITEIYYVHAGPAIDRAEQQVSRMAVERKMDALYGGGDDE